jgi:hypothetical protein
MRGAFARSASGGGRLLALALLLALAACRPAERQWEPAGERPADVLDRETMISVLTDMHLAEGDALERALSPERSDSLLAVHYARIARENGTDLATIHRSYLWYVARPLTMKDLYAEVIERLNRLQGEWQADPSAMP